VGPPLPGVEIRIEDPDAEGVGEVLAKGPNVMAAISTTRRRRRRCCRTLLRPAILGKLDEEGH